MNLPVCYKMCSTNRICWSKAISIEGHGKHAILRFDNGGWNPIDSCFLTEEQCRKFHKLPPKDWNRVNFKIADRLERLAESIRKNR